MKKKILLALSILFGLMFINSGLNKFFNYLPVPENMPENVVKTMTAFMTIGWLMPLVGAVEVIGGIFFITNRFRALGAAMLLPIMVGVLLNHIMIAPEGLPIVIVLFAILIWAMIDNKDKYLPLIK